MRHIANALMGTGFFGFMMGAASADSSSMIYPVAIIAASMAVCGVGILIDRMLRN